MTVAASNLAHIGLGYELESAVEQNLNRRLAVAKEWFPREYIPWSRGRDFDGALDGGPWEPGRSTLRDAARPVPAHAHTPQEFQAGSQGRNFRSDSGNPQQFIPATSTGTVH